MDDLVPILRLFRFRSYETLPVCRSSYRILNRDVQDLLRVPHDSGTGAESKQAADETQRG